MRYEVRGQDGKLFGKLTVEVRGRGVELMVLPDHRRRALTAGVLKPQRVVLELDDTAQFRGQKIPTLVLREGKRTWLNRVLGFSRI